MKLKNVSSTANGIVKNMSNVVMSQAQDSQVSKSVTPEIASVQVNLSATRGASKQKKILKQMTGYQ